MLPRPRPLQPQVRGPLSSHQPWPSEMRQEQNDYVPPAMNLRSEERQMPTLISGKRSRVWRPPSNRRPQHRQNPEAVAACIDPSLRPALWQWQKDTRALFRAHLTQQDLTNKYEKLETNGEMWNQFKTEAAKTWPWMQLYLLHAKPTSLQADLDYERKKAHDTPYKVDESWTMMRERHARECDCILAKT